MRRKSSSQGEHTSPSKPDGQVASLPAYDSFSEFPGLLLPDRTTHVVEEKRSRLVPGGSQVLYRRNAMGSDGILRPGAFFAHIVQQMLRRVGISYPGLPNYNFITTHRSTSRLQMIDQVGRYHNLTHSTAYMLIVLLHYLDILSQTVSRLNKAFTLHP